MWNTPKEGEEPRFAIRRFRELADESYKARFIDTHGVYWDNMGIIPPVLSGALESYLAVLNNKLCQQSQDAESGES